MQNPVLQSNRLNSLTDSQRLLYDAYYEMSHLLCTKIHTIVTDFTSVPHDEIENVFDLIDEIEFYMPMSKSCFPTKAILNRWTSQCSSNYLPDLLTSISPHLISLCKNQRTCELLEAIKLHLTECRTNNVRVNSHTPCLSIITAYSKLVTPTQQIGLSKFMIPMLSDRLSNHLSDYCRRATCFPIHSSFDSDTYRVPSNLSANLLAKIETGMHLRRKSVPAVLTVRNFFLTKFDFMTSVPTYAQSLELGTRLKLSFPITTQIMHTLDQRPSTPRSIANDEYTTTISYPIPTDDGKETTYHLQLFSDPRDVIIYLINGHDFYSGLFPDQPCPTDHSPRRIVTTIVRDAYILGHDFGFNYDSIYPTSDAMYRAMTHVYDTRPSLPYQYRNASHEETFNKTEILGPLMKTASLHADSEVPLKIRRSLGLIKLKHLTSHSLFTFCMLMICLSETYKVTTDPDLPVPDPAPNALSLFLQTYPGCNYHSLRMYDYFQSFEVPDDMVLPPLTRFFKNLAQKSSPLSWFQLKRLPTQVSINSNRMMTLRVNFTSNYDSIPNAPPMLSQHERDLVRRLGPKAPGYQFSQQRSATPVEFDIHMFGSAEYEYYDERHE